MSSDQRLRLFIAVSVPRDVLESLSRAVEGLRTAMPGGRWAPPENQHVTLKFLGTTPATLRGQVEGVVRESAEAHSGAALRLTSLGSFPSRRRARVLWAGLQDDQGFLSALAGDLDARLAPLGFAAEKRAFTPHLTVARWREPARVPAPLPDLPPNAGKLFTVSTVELFRSYLSPKGARYEVLGEFPLAGRSARIAGQGHQGANQ